MVKICNTQYPTESQYNSYFEKWNYPLSDFQKHAIQGIIEENHVLITAHTGSGKTLPALFAIEYFVKRGKKVIYTSPIKALSNQKFWEFSQKFKQIGIETNQPEISLGLLTGDIKYNPMGNVLIMTTEILMNYLFRKDESHKDNVFEIDVENDLGCVIFDEVHYINDPSRGHVWEQTILMLPPHIQMVMLSATIDNPKGFGEWIENSKTTETHNKKVCLCSTETRVVPLTHYSFMTVSEGIYKGIKDDVLKQEIRNQTNQLITLKTEKGIFQENNYCNVKKMLDVFHLKQQTVKRKFAVNSLLTFLKERDMLPAIIFVFSRKQVEQLAQEITANLLEDDSKIPYTISSECEQIIRRSLPNYREYLELPEYNSLVKLLEKGIGIHHSGMIPILREMVELFISNKHIKVLVATESFAIGLDCPIKTSVFISLTKFDGNAMRLLEPHEYSQMSGRAGRRGIDTVGNVVHLSNLFALPSVNEYREILCGKPQKLESKFQISYSLLLSLMTSNKGRIHLSEVNQFVEKSMSFNDIQHSISVARNEIRLLEANLKKKMEFLKLLKTPEAVLEKYVLLQEGLEMASQKKRKDILKECLKIKDEHRNFDKDIISFMEKEEIIKTLHQENVYLNQMENYIRVQILNITSIMEEYGYLEELDTDGSFHYTKLGELASHFAEVHPLIMSQLILQTDELKDFTFKQIVGLLSCFTNIKMETDETTSIVKTEDKRIKMALTHLATFCEDLERKELQHHLHIPDNVLMFDLIDLMMEWCDCADEETCKYFIQQKLSVKGISIGDFTKAVLKIQSIVQEIEKAVSGNVELLYQCSLIPANLLKYITNQQSLYI